MNTLHQQTLQQMHKNQSWRENTGFNLRTTDTFSSIDLVVGGYRTGAYRMSLPLSPVFRNCQLGDLNNSRNCT